MSRKVCVIGVGHTDFNSITSDVQWKEIMYEACNKAYVDAGINPRRDVGSFITCAEDYWEGFSIFDEFVPDQVGAVLRPCCTVCGDGIYGLGTAYIEGFRWAMEKGYLYICEMDADFSHNPNDLPRLFESCEKSADVTIGSRYISGVNVVNWPMSRVLISYFASVYVRLITRMKVRDATAGFVCYRREVLDVINLEKIKFKGYAFQIEMKFKAWKYGFNVVELPIIFTDRKEGTSKMSGKIVSEAIFGVIGLKIRSWFKNYKRVPGA